MKKKRKFKILFISMITFILYLSGAEYAMAGELHEPEIAGESAGAVAGPEEGPEAEPSAGPAEEPETEPSNELAAGSELSAEPAVGLESVRPDETIAEPEPVAGPEEGSEEEPTAKPEKEPEPAAGPEEEPEAEPSVKPEEEPEPTAGPAEEPEAEYSVGAAAKPEGALTADSAAEPEPDSVSTAEEFQAWMEEHKNIGGFLRLADDITLTGYQVFIPDGPGSPHIIVETAGHTITISGEVEFWNDDHLTFRGGMENPVVFHVAKGGMLTLNNVSVESMSMEEEAAAASVPYVLWQEEGAGLIIAGGRISGEIRYADTPFVIYGNEACLIVGKGQQAVLPDSVICDVNYRGQVRNNELLPVSWELAGTEQQQEKRLRFQVSGSYDGAAAVMPPVCTVIYNDYPLTFTEVKASVSDSAYIFRAEYTKPEALLPVVITAEYSFDGENWLLYEEKNVSDMNDMFFFGLTDDQWNTTAYPYLYLRLRCEHEGVRYYSNVLRYAADDLRKATDQGGSRGGGTAIVNPSKDPEKEPGNSKPGSTEKPVTGPEGSGNDFPAKPEDDGNSPPSEPEGGENGSQTKPAEGTAGDSVDGETDGKALPPTEGGSDPAAGSNEEADGTIHSVYGQENSPGAETGILTENPKQRKDSVEENTKHPESGAPDDMGQPESGAPDNMRQPESSAPDNMGQPESGAPDNMGQPESSAPELGVPKTEKAGSTAAAVSASRPSDAGPQSIEKAAVSTFGRNLAIAAGFVGLSAAAGAVGFCGHTGVFRHLFKAAGKWFR